MNNLLNKALDINQRLLNKRMTFIGRLFSLFPNSSYKAFEELFKAVVESSELKRVNSARPSLKVFNPEE